MASLLEKKKQEIDRTLVSSMEAADSVITKSYLDKLEHCAIVKPSEEDVDIEVAQCGQFYRLSKLVFNKDERFLDKLTTIVNVAHSIDGTIATIIKSDGNRVNYYIGIINKSNRHRNEHSLARREASSAAFSGAIRGNLIGSDVAVLSPAEVAELQQNIFGDSNQAVSAVSGIVALRDGDERGIAAYVQGIEHLVDSLRGQRYAIVLVADPIRNGELQTIKQGYELLHTQLSSFWRGSVTLNENSSETNSLAQSEGISTGISTGIAMTQSKSSSTSKFGAFGGSVGLSVPIPYVPLNVGASYTRGSAKTEGAGTSETRQNSETEQQNRNTTTTSGTAKGEGSSLQLHYENKSVKALLDKIDKHLERLDVCESFGAFNSAAYVIAGDRNVALTVSSNYNALMRGEQSSVQTSFINCWHKKADVETLLTYLNSFVHPRFASAGDQLVLTPASIVNGNEMAIQIGLPKKSVSGISVIPMAPFGRNVREVSPEKALKLGELFHMGQPDGSSVTLDTQTLAAHTFITGSTGAGKSNTIYQLLSKLEDKGVRFLVVEPAKGEYKHVFGNRADVNVWGTNEAIAPMLRINPFAFPDGIHVLEHIDRLVDIFNVCWPMYSAMPAVLKEAIEDAYRTSGWDLIRSVNAQRDQLFPTFVDLLESLSKVISNSAYSDELKSNYKGALLTRVKSLTNGLNGLMLCNGEVDLSELYDGNTIVDLSRIGSAETKSLMMGILVMRLQEHRMSQGGMNLPLSHVTVLEEAHHLLKRTSSEQSMEGANMLGKSVEMLANAIAEMRTYGEGFIIADQAPGLLDAAVIRNTNTKIVLQTPDWSDRQLVGKAANLNDEQIVELAKLPAGVAAVYQNRWLEPVLCKMEPYRSEGRLYRHVVRTPERDEKAKRFTRDLLDMLLHNRLSVRTEPNVDLDRLEAELRDSPLSARTKKAVYPLLAEYREMKRLTIWDKKRFAELSAIVAEIVGFGDEPQGGLLPQADEVTELFGREVNRSIGEVEEDMLLAICQCLLKFKSSAGEDWLKLFYMWDYNTRMGKMG